VDSQRIALTIRLARHLIRVRRPNESLTDFVHNMRQTYDDLNESCLMADGPVLLHKHFLNCFILVGMFQEGANGQAKQ
jgi:hypothetical protein